MSNITRFDYNESFPHLLGNDPEFRRNLVVIANVVKKEIPSHLPSGRGGGRRVSAFGRKTYTEVKGSGRETYVEVGTRWRLGHLIEFGGPRNPPYSPVRKSVIGLGMKFRLGGGG